MAFALVRSGDKHIYNCLSTDTKETAGISTDAICIETDTGDKFEFDGDSWVEVGVGGVAKVALTHGHGQEGANKIAAIAISAASQATASIPEQRVIVHNASSAIIFIEAGVGAVAVSGTSQPLAAGASVEILKSADSEIAVIGTAAAGNVHFSPQVSINE